MAFVAPLIIGGLAAAGAVSAVNSIVNKQKEQALPVQQPAQTTQTAATIQEDSKAKAKADLEKRRRISLLSGGNTDLTRGTALTTGNQIATKNLVGQ